MSSALRHQPSRFRMPKISSSHAAAFLQAVALTSSMAFIVFLIFQRVI